MDGYAIDVETATLTNSDYRRVLYTGRFTQLVLMAIPPGEEIGSETHDSHDQFFRFEAGTGAVMIDNTRHEVSDGVAVIVPAGARHNVINTSSDEPLLLYTLYSPPEHPDGLVEEVRQG